MKTPINGARLSSGYGLRKHPILGLAEEEEYAEGEEERFRRHSHAGTD